MMSGAAELLALHGVVILFLGVLAGFPYWVAIIREWTESSVRAWRVTHLLLTVDGLVLIVVGLVLPAAALGDGWNSFIAWNLILSGYGFSWAFVLGAASGHRALIPSSRMWDLVLFPGHVVGAAGSVLGLGALLMGMLWFQ